MAGSRVKPRTLQIIKMHKKGLQVWQIAKELDVHATLVVAAIRRAQLRGDLPPPMRRGVEAISDLKRVYRVGIGSLGVTLERESTPEVWKFAAERTIAGGYETLAEYAADLITEAYYEEGQIDD